MKNKLLTLLWVYLGLVGMVGIILCAVSLLTGAGIDGRGFPLPAAVAISLGAALILFGIFLSIAIGIFVYCDALERGMSGWEPLVWALVAVFVPYFLGLIAYLVVRQSRHRPCPDCGASNNSDQVYCASCGSALRRRCGTCQGALPRRASFCPHCGAAADVPPAPPSTPPEAPPATP